MIREDDPLWRRWRLAAIALLSAALFLPSVWTRDLWDPDEPRYAEATREMGRSGDLLVPRFNGEIYSEKPPLFFWLSLAAGKIPGVPAGSGGRLVGVLASAGTLLLTWRIGALLMGEATGALAAALLSACILFWDLAQSGVIDPLLAFCVTASIYGYARHVRGRRPGMAIFYVAAAAGVLAKGPVGLIVPALAAMTHALFAGGWRALRARHPLWGIPLVLAPVMAWLLLASARAGPGYFETMVFKQNVGRAVHAYVHREAWWYYFEVGPLVLMPLTLFLPQALVTAWREKIHGIRPILLPLAWFASTALFFTAVSSKKTRYLLALAPAAALLVAGWFMRRYLTADGKIRHGRALLCVAACGALAIAALLALPAVAGEGVIPGLLMAPLRNPASRAALAALRDVLAWPGSLRLLLPAAVLATAAIAGLRMALARRPESLVALLGGWLAFLAIAGAAWTPVLDEVKSARDLAALARRRAATGTLYLLRYDHTPGLNFYLQEDRIPEVRSRGARLRAAREPGATFLGEKAQMDRIEDKLGIRFTARSCLRVGSRILCVASASPPAEVDAPRAASALRQPVSRTATDP